jgi:hypothetical protein
MLSIVKDQYTTRLVSLLPICPRIPKTSLLWEVFGSQITCKPGFVLIRPIARAHECWPSI